MNSNMNHESTLLSCPLCFKYFDLTTRLPRIIPTCGHTICESCVDRCLIQSQQTFRCPEDGEIVFCPRENVESFAKNISIIRAIPNQQQNVYLHSEVYTNGFPTQEVSTKKPIMLPEVMLDVMELRKQLQINEEEVKRSQQQQQYTSLASMSMSPVTLVCQPHHKIMDLGCITCQEKICSHCVIFGEHKNHVVVPEDEVKEKNSQGMSDMKSIQESIERTKQGFFKQMENNFEFTICKQIAEKKQVFLQNSRHKYQVRAKEGKQNSILIMKILILWFNDQEYKKLLQHAEQRTQEQIEKFFTEIEEKFRKFKNHNFSETYEKIHSFNKMVEDVEVQSEMFLSKAELNFDFYMNLDKLIATAKDIELEFNNLLDFPLKLVNNYLGNLSISFSDSSIVSAFSNIMTLAYSQPESEVIQQSIQHLTLANQREILMNSPFNKHLLEKLSNEEIEQILTTDVPLTPTQTFFNQQSEIAQKQKYSIVPPQLNPPQQQQQLQSLTTLSSAARRASSSQDSRRSIPSTYSQRGAISSKNNLRESKPEVNLDNVNQVISEMSSVRQRNILPNSLRESTVGLQKDKMLLSHIETQEDFIRNTNFNGSSFQTEIVADPILNAFQYRQIQSQFEPITTSQIGQKSHIEYSTKQPESHQTQLITSSNFGKPSRIEQSNIIYMNNNNNNNNNISTPSKDHLSTTSFQVSPRLPANKTPTREAKQTASYSTLSARLNQKSTSPISSHRSGLKTPTRSTSPISQSSQISSKSSASSQLRLEDLQRPLGNMAHDNQERTIVQEPTMKSQLLSMSKIKNSTSTKTNLMKIIKQQQTPQNHSQNLTSSKQAVNLHQQAERNLSSSQLGSSTHLRKSGAINFKKKSEKFQLTMQRLRAHEFIDVLELVNEDINDLEAEELANELSRSQSNLESIKLVKNKIGNLGLKAILEGLIAGGHNIHTLNLTNNICTEFCFFDLIQYIEINPHLKNIYLLNNSIQPNRNKDHFKTIQSLCNLHL